MIASHIEKFVQVISPTSPSPGAPTTSIRRERHTQATDTRNVRPQQNAWQLLAQVCELGRRRRNGSRHGRSMTTLFSLSTRGTRQPAREMGLNFLARSRPVPVSDTKVPWGKRPRMGNLISGSIRASRPRPLVVLAGGGGGEESRFRSSEVLSSPPGGSPPARSMHAVTRCLMVAPKACRSSRDLQETGKLCQDRAGAEPPASATRDDRTHPGLSAEGGWGSKKPCPATGRWWSSTQHRCGSTNLQYIFSLTGNSDGFLGRRHTAWGRRGAGSLDGVYTLERVQITRPRNKSCVSCQSRLVVWKWRRGKTLI